MVVLAWSSSHLHAARLDMRISVRQGPPQRVRTLSRDDACRMRRRRSDRTCQTHYRKTSRSVAIP